MTKTQAIDLGAGDPDILAFAARHLGGAIPSLGNVSRIVFTPTTTTVPGMTFEYAVTGDKVRFHVFKTGDAWPADAESILQKGFATVSQFLHALEFVPEVDSWYIELRDLPVQLTDTLVESLVSKVAAAS